MGTFIQLPATIPSFVADGFGFQDDDRFATAQRGSGHSRKRRVRTSAQRRFRSGWVLSPAQVQALDAWFETTLRVGELPFIARVRSEDGRVRFWTAMWASPYSAEPFGTAHGTFWRVSGEIVAFGVPLDAAPSTGALEAEDGFALDAVASIEGRTRLFAEDGFALSRAVGLFAEDGFDVQQYIASFRLRAAGGFRLRAGSGKRLRSSDG